MLESALLWKALAGWSPISITSVVATIPNRSAGHPSEASTDLIFSSSPNSTIRLSDPIERHDGSLDSRFGCIIAAHGIYANLYHTRTSVG